MIFNRPFKTDWLFDVEILMRINNAFPAHDIIFEYPLNEWAHKSDSKIIYRDLFSIIKGIIKLFCFKI